MAKKDRVLDIDRKVVSTTSSPKAVYTNMRHDAMRNRGLSNQHPIDAITDLRAELNTIPHTLLELDDMEHNYISPYQILEVNDTLTGMEFSERLNWRGNWIAGTYYKQDAVRYNSSLYAANKQTDTQPGSVDWDMLATDGTGSGGNLPPGGSTSQTLLKSSDADYDVAWGSHQSIDGSGVHSHAEIDTHIDDVTSNPHDVKYSQLSDAPDLSGYLPISGHVHGATEAIQRFGKGIGVNYIDENTPDGGVTIDGLLIKDYGIPSPKFGTSSVVGQVLVAIDDIGNAEWGDGGGKWLDDEFGIHYNDGIVSISADKAGNASFPLYIGKSKFGISGIFMEVEDSGNYIQGAIGTFDDRVQFGSISNHPVFIMQNDERRIFIGTNGKVAFYDDIRIRSASAAAGKVLTAIDSDGNSEWQDAAGGKWIDDEHGIHYMDSVGIGVESPTSGLLVQDRIETKGILKVEGFTYFGADGSSDYFMYVGGSSGLSSNIVQFVNEYSSLIKLYDNGLLQINPSSGESEVVGDLRVVNNVGQAHVTVETTAANESAEFVLKNVNGTWRTISNTVGWYALLYEDTSVYTRWYIEKDGHVHNLGSLDVSEKLHVLGAASGIDAVNDNEFVTLRQLNTKPSGSGTLNILPMWTPDGNALGDSIVYQDNKTIHIDSLDNNDFNIPALHIKREMPSDAAGPITSVLIQNTGEVAGSNDYQNEVHVRLQAGTSSNHRRYINFADYNGVDKWVTGANAQDTWIMYDSVGQVHRFWFEQAGTTYINSVGSHSVSINYHSTDECGTGGFAVYSGGTPANNKSVFHTSEAYTKFVSNYVIFGNDLDSDYNVFIDAGKTSAQKGYLVYRDRGTTLWSVGKHSNGAHVIYDHVNSLYGMFILNKKVGIFLSAPNAAFHIKNPALQRGMIVQAADGQTHNIVEVQHFDGSVLAEVSSSGRIRGTSFLIGTGSNLPYISNDAGHLHVANPDGNVTVGSGRTMHVEGSDNVSITSWGLSTTLEVSNRNAGGDTSIALQITEHGWYFMNGDDIVLRIDTTGQIYSDHVDILPL